MPTRPLENNVAEFTGRYDKTSAQLSLFLLVYSDVNRYLIPIHEASEVTDFVGLKPFPVANRGHLGVINLHGEVVPILSLAELIGGSGSRASRPMETLAASKANRVLIISPLNGSPIGIICESIRKVAIEIPKIEAGIVVSFEREPVKILTWDSIRESLGAA